MDLFGPVVRASASAHKFAQASSLCALPLRVGAPRLRIYLLHRISILRAESLSFIFLQNAVSLFSVLQLASVSFFTLPIIHLVLLLYQWSW